MFFVSPSSFPLTFSFLHSPPFSLSFYTLSSFSLSPSLPPSVSPDALRSTTQQPLNYSHQTTLCIFCAVPLHPSRIFPVSHGCLCSFVYVSVSACVCAHAGMLSCACTSVCAPAYVSLLLFLIFFSFLPPLMEAICSCLIFTFIENVTTCAHTHRQTHTQTYPQSKTVGLYVVISLFLLL